MPSGTIHNEALAGLIKPSYSAAEISYLTRLLEQNGTLNFPALPNGLFPAAAAGDIGTSGYRYVWVRDNVYVAYAHLENGREPQACATARALTNYFHRHRGRFIDIIDGRIDGANPMDRPHIRFDGETLDEVGEKWAHAQNDALGYYLWLVCRLLLRDVIKIDGQCAEVIACMGSYLRAIRYWQDEDSGHWEETRKVAASSIGVVVGALRLLKQAIGGSAEVRKLVANASRPLQPDTVEELIDQGERALGAILPAECIQPDPGKHRECDGALLFLVYPIAVVERTMADRIIERVVERLQGEFGIRRYPGDSYWCPDYKELLSAEERTVDFSDQMATRDAMLKAAGDGAQWCIFDSILSAIYGSRFVDSKDPADLERQSFYLNRSLGQITANFRCPEAYYKERGRWVPNDNTPLLWAQANLWMALRHVEDSLRAAP